MAKPKEAVDRGPLLGALLRLAHRELLLRIERNLEKSDFGDFRTAQSAVTQQLWDHPEGLRLTDLAADARMTKPSMSALISGLEESGYVERVVDPDDGRAMRVQLTARGKKLVAHLRATVRAIEAEWAEIIGADGVETLRALLQRLLAAQPSGAR